MSLRTLAGFPLRKEIRCPVYFPLGVTGTKEYGSNSSWTGESSDMKGWGAMPSWTVLSPAATHDKREASAASVCPGALQEVSVSETLLD